MEIEGSSEDAQDHSSNKKLVQACCRSERDAVRTVKGNLGVGPDIDNFGPPAAFWPNPAPGGLVKGPGRAPTRSPGTPILRPFR